jgi:hypothetical protein
VNPLLVWSPPVFAAGWDSKQLFQEFCFFRLFMYALSCERVYTCYLGNDAFSAVCCNGKMITESLSSNGRLAPNSIFRLSGVMSRHQQ